VEDNLKIFNQKKINYILFVYIYWSVSRFLLGITTLIISQFFLIEFKDLENLNYAVSIGIIVKLILKMNWMKVY